MLQRPSRDRSTPIQWIGALLVLLSLAPGWYAHAGGSVMTARTTGVVTKLDGSTMELTYRDAHGVEQAPHRTARSNR